MMIYLKEFTALAGAIFILTSCAPEKKETPPPPPPPTVPAPPPPVAPPAQPEKNKEILIPAMPLEKPKDTLTPQQEKLIIEEEDIEPFPG